MPRQIKWFLIIVAGLAVIGLGQLGDSLATQPGGGEAHHGPPGAPPPPPPTAPPAPPPTVTVPGAVVRDLPPPPPEKTVAGSCEPGGGPGTRAYYGAQRESAEWRSENFDWMANDKIDNIKGQASAIMENINRDIKRAQDRFHAAHMERDKYQNQKQRGTLLDDDLLKDAQKELQEASAELQRQKARIEKVEDWRNKSIGEVGALKDRAKNGDYHGYRGLQNYETSFHPSWFK